MSLYKAIKKIYPEINDDDFIVYDDGTGEVILRWDSDLPLPPPELLNSTVVESELQLLKNLKSEELNKACSEAILNRFSAQVDGVTYYFSNDMEAQANFEKCDRAFEKGRLTELPWTAYDVDGNVVRVVLTPATFEGVYLSHLNHIQSNISKFRDTLMPLIEAVTTVEEVNSITWE